MNPWSKGLLAAFITSSSSVVAAYAIDPEHFGLSHTKHMAIAALLGGVMGVAGYLKKAPWPDDAKKEQ